MIQVQLNLCAIFDVLVQFCVSENLEAEFFTDLVAILMLLLPEACPLTLAVLIIISGSTKSIKWPEKYERLFEFIDKCISISFMSGAFDFLLCSAFLNLNIPCNLLGIVSLSVKEVLVSDNNNYRTLIEAITERKPYLVLFWKEAMCTDQAISLFTIIMKDLSSICLVAGLWTNTIQSFFQVLYKLGGTEESSVFCFHDSASHIFVDPKRRYLGMQLLLSDQQLHTISALKFDSITAIITGLYDGDHTGLYAQEREFRQLRRNGLLSSLFISYKIHRVIVYNINISSKFEISSNVSSH